MATTPLRRPVFEDIKDEVAREAMQWFYEYLIAQPLLQGEFEHFEFTFDNTPSVTHLVTHSLGFKPSDIITTSTIGAGSVTFDYDDFTEEVISITTSGGEVTVRFFGGRYEPSNVF